MGVKEKVTPQITFSPHLFILGMDIFDLGISQIEQKKVK